MRWGGYEAHQAALVLAETSAHHRLLPHGQRHSSLGMQAVRVAAVIFSFFVPGKIPGMNEVIAAAKGCGGRGLGYSAQKKRWGQAITAIIRSHKPPKMNRVHVSFAWHEAKANRDPDNISSGQKFVFDSLVDAGVIPNDGQKNVAGFVHSFEVSKTPGVWVEVEETYVKEA
jgi:Holliday junction resolvase RusA-like endonuclease